MCLYVCTYLAAIVRFVVVLFYHATILPIFQETVAATAKRSLSTPTLTTTKKLQNNNIKHHLQHLHGSRFLPPAQIVLHIAVVVVVIAVVIVASDVAVACGGDFALHKIRNENKKKEIEKPAKRDL